MTISQLELVDFNRNQFESEKFPKLLVAALISIPGVQYESMTEEGQIGTAEVAVTLYCRDGWRDQHNGTTDPEHGLIEIDLLDEIAEKLQFLYGDNFAPLQQTNDEEQEVDMSGMFAYKQTFDTRIKRKIGRKYTTRSITHEKDI
ncbi:hypothetical protein EGI11_03235 [Chryseobacterium sp. H3056]|uniref:Uncharacterized protein n=2 Tax=Kaistella daneshvariae TaxID=2487074 RepID=A0A3N0WXV8_9FLAO|nr:hypothetical protein EGI11_03235 [Kaistella daneshvariae]